MKLGVESKGFTHHSVLFAHVSVCVLDKTTQPEVTPTRPLVRDC